MVLEGMCKIKHLPSETALNLCDYDINVAGLQEINTILREGQWLPPHLEDGVNC